MNKIIVTSLSIFATFVFFAVLTSCSKSSPGPAPVLDPCAGKSIVITPVITNAAACSGNGRIRVSATGSTGFSYKLNSGGLYQVDDSFGNVAAGAYTVFAKDADGCEHSVPVTIGTIAAGPLFTAVKVLVAAKCQSCHNNSIQNGSQNWEIECNIISKSDRINARAVVEGTMPAAGSPLSASEKSIISNWISAGARYDN